MLTPPDKKSVSALILSKMKPDAEVANEEVDPKMEGLKASAEDIIGAIQSKSAVDLVSALNSYFDQKEQEEDAEQGEGGEGTEPEAAE